MRHDRGADVVVGPQAADVIEVRMRADQPADRLVRRELGDLLDDGEAALFAARRFEHRDEIAELDHVAVGRAAAEQVHAVGHLLDRHGAGFGGCACFTDSGTGTGSSQTFAWTLANLPP